MTHSLVAGQQILQSVQEHFLDGGLLLSLFCEHIGKVEKQ